MRNGEGIARKLHLRRQANHIVAQLPDEPREALYVIEQAARIIREFVLEDSPSRSVESIDSHRQSRRGQNQGMS